MTEFKFATALVDLGQLSFSVSQYRLCQGQTCILGNLASWTWGSWYAQFAFLLTSPALPHSGDFNTTVHLLWDKIIPTEKVRLKAFDHSEMWSYSCQPHCNLYLQGNKIQYHTPQCLCSALFKNMKCGKICTYTEPLYKVNWPIKTSNLTWVSPKPI